MALVVSFLDMNADLIDRDTELRALEAAWVDASAGSPQLVVMWGRRRVGKTFLLTHFARRKRAVFFGATQQAERIELARMADAVHQGLGAEVRDRIPGEFAGWESAFRFLSTLASDEPLLVVLDEVPYLTRSTIGFASVVQGVWDHLEPRRLMLVLTGSAVGVMEGLLGGHGALHGRPTRTLRMNPLGPKEARAFLQNLDPARFLEAYAACGGYPLHLLAWNQDASTEQNLLRLAGASGGVLLEDAAGILAEELPDVGGYPRILAAIGRGRTRSSEIATDAAQRIEHPLDILVRSGFVRRSVPVGAPARARPRYELADPYLAFWFSVLYADLALVEGGQGRAVLRRRRELWQRHLGWTFEEASRLHAAHLVAAGRLPEDLVVGRWWAPSGTPCEVDVLGLRGSRTALLGEARWQAAPLRRRVLENLMLRSARVPDPVPDPIYALWGRGGADEAVRATGALIYDVSDVVGDSSR